MGAQDTFGCDRSTNLTSIGYLVEALIRRNE